jgi:hypothetical protein
MRAFVTVMFCALATPAPASVNAMNHDPHNLVVLMFFPGG